MIFHQTVSAQRHSAPFTATPSSFLSASPVAKLISFKSTTIKGKISLNWVVSDNQDADRFEIERSLDGKIFEMAALVFGTDKAGNDNYQFFEKENKSKTFYYRVKTIGKIGRAHV